MSQHDVQHESLVAPPTFMPSGWPVAEPELLMGYVGLVMVIRIGGAVAPLAFDRYLAEWLRAVDARPGGAAVFTMYDMPEWPGMTGTQRAQWGATLRSREDTLRRTTSGMVLASPSTLTRGGASALFGLAPPPYPHAVVDTPRAALAYIAERGGPPAEAAGAAYQALEQSYWRAAD
jgi:hypothetical protein